MANFGEMLRSEREDRGLSIADVSRVLEVDQDRLRALEQNDFAALPDEAIMLDCLRAYADCLQVEADLMIEDYVRERDLCLQELADAIPDRNVEIVPDATPSNLDRRRRHPGLLVVSLSVAVVVVVGLWWMLSGDEPASSTAPPRADTATLATDRPMSGPTPAPTIPVEALQAPAESPTEGTVLGQSPAAAGQSSLRIPAFGVGTAVRDRQLVGRGDRFVEGTQVWFWTQVEGGAQGDRIDHVWLREGVEATRISLTIGGRRWRTQSSKTLRADAAGDWAVEARDATGRVLSRVEFACVP